MKTPLNENINTSKVLADYKADIKKAAPTIDVSFVSNLLGEVFGVESPVYLPTWWQGREFSPREYPGLEIEKEDPEYDDAPVRMGNKTFGAFWLKEGDYLRFTHNAEPKRYKYPRFLMPLATLVDFTREKRVSKTPTVGSGGTVKEVFSLDDWDISIKGIIIPDADNIPEHRTVESQMDIIQKFAEIAGSIEVEGQIFAQRNITRIVIESLTFSPVQGRPKMMQYSIKAVSDEDILLTGIE